MKHDRVLTSCAALLLALLAVNPAAQAAKKKARAPQKEAAAKTALATPQEQFQKHVEQEIGSLRDDVYTRATWKKLQEVKQQTDETAGSLKLVSLSAAFIGFVVGCAVTFLVAKGRGGSDGSLKIT